jgi:hypothetical protein
MALALPSIYQHDRTKKATTEAILEASKFPVCVVVGVWSPENVYFAQLRFEYVRGEAEIVGL